VDGLPKNISPQSPSGERWIPTSQERKEKKRKRKEKQRTFLSRNIMPRDVMYTLDKLL
jgi:hypothetical protein